MIKNEKTIGKVRTIIITTDKGDIILTPNKNSKIVFTTTEEYGTTDSCICQKEVLIKTVFENLIVTE